MKLRACYHLVEGVQGPPTISHVSSHYTEILVVSCALSIHVRESSRALCVLLE